MSSSGRSCWPTRISSLLGGLFLVSVSCAKPLPVRNAGAELVGENLVVNGSFEEGPDVGAWLSLDVGSTVIKGWKVTRGQIDYTGTNWRAADGKRSIDLHGSPGFGGIEQTI